MGQHWEILIPVVLLALLFFGPKRLPEIGSSIGKTIKEFQKSMREVKEPEPPTAAALPPAATTGAPHPQLPQASAAPAAQAAAPSTATSATLATPATPEATEPKASETSVS
jgi:sec-independent protein translocase protein TatA